MLSGIIPAPGYRLQYEVIATSSRKLSDIAKRWTPQAKEMYAVVDAVKKLAPFLLGGPFILDTDNSNNLNWSSSTDIKTMHWIDYLSAFDIVRKRLIPRSSNLAADAITQVMKSGNLEIHSVHLMEVAHLVEEIQKAPFNTNQSLSTIAASAMLQGVINNALLDKHYIAAAKVTDVLQRLHDIPDDIKSLFDAVHNSHNGHWKVQEAMKRMAALDPGISFSEEQVRVMVSTCLTCQKFQNVRPPVTILYKSLMSSKALSRIGVDLAQFFANESGYCYIIVIVDHFDKHVFLEPTMEKTALSLARTLFRYFTLFGTPDELRSDPGSDLTSNAVKILLETFKVQHSFSLVDIHTGNGAEPTIREVLRHLKNLIFDSNSRQHWHQPEYLQAVASIINNHVNVTTGFSPNMLRFGTGLHHHFDLASRATSTNPATYAGQLDAMLSTLADCSSRYQLANIKEKQSSNADAYHFLAGDLVFVKVTNITKPNARYKGPYIVTEQHGNNVMVQSLIDNTCWTFFSGRLQLFFGDVQEAQALARYDTDQHLIQRIIDYRGSPTNRSTMEFLVVYEDGDELWHPWGKDITDTAAYIDFYTIQQPELSQLQFPAGNIPEQTRCINQKGFSSDVLADKVIYANLRTWGDAWYQSLNLPTGNYLVPGTITAFNTTKRGKATLHLASIFFSIMNEVYKVSPFNLQFLYQSNLQPGAQLVTSELIKSHPRILQLSS